MLAATTRLLLGQRLVKRLCPVCRHPHRRTEALEERHGPLFEAARKTGTIRGHGSERCSFFEPGGGCESCKQSGFLGRLGIFEAREIRGPVADMLLRQRSRFDPKAAEFTVSTAVLNGDVGSRSMREDGILKAALGLTTPEEVYGATMEAA